LELLGQERALIYKTLVLTGLRKGELASLTVGQVELDGPCPSATLHAADEKNRTGSEIPLRSDHANDLRVWLKQKLERLQYDAGGLNGQMCLPLTPVLQKLPPETPVFTVPRDLVRILDRDLVAAGIARRVKIGPQKWKSDKRDARGRPVDVHAMRTTYGTLLSKGGVAPRVAQAAMRHSTIDLTMNVYTDPKLLDVQGALDALTPLPLRCGESAEEIAAKSTGTDDFPASPLAPTRITPGKPWSSIVAREGRTDDDSPPVAPDIRSCPIKRNTPLTSGVIGVLLERETGFEPATSSLGS